MMTLISNVINPAFIGFLFSLVLSVSYYIVGSYNLTVARVSLETDDE